MSIYISKNTISRNYSVSITNRRGRYQKYYGVTPSSIGRLSDFTRQARSKRTYREGSKLITAIEL